MHKKIFAVLVSLAFLISYANAFNVEISRSVIVFPDAPATAWITVENTLPIEQNLEVKFFSPANSDFVNVPETVPQNSETKFALRILPRQDLEGQTYESTLVVELGNEKITKKINVSFKQAEEKLLPQPKPEPAGIDLNSISRGVSTGFASMVAFGEENAINLALILIAAILLLAFIARFARRIIK